MVLQDHIKTTQNKTLISNLKTEIRCTGDFELKSYGTCRGLATYASSMSFGYPEHCFLSVWTPKSLGQDLLMMTILEDSACSVTPIIQTKQLPA